jgi:hypothetical protein
MNKTRSAVSSPAGLNGLSKHGVLVSSPAGLKMEFALCANSGGLSKLKPAEWMSNCLCEAIASGVLRKAQNSKLKSATRI